MPRRFPFWASYSMYRRQGIGKRCVCGKRIPFKWSLCGRCSNIYGMNRSKWPKWLHFQVNDIQREIDAMLDNPEIPLSDRRRRSSSRGELHSYPIRPGAWQPKITTLLEGEQGSHRGCYDPYTDPSESEYRRLCGPPESRGYTEDCIVCGRPTTPKNDLCTICRWPYL